MVGMPRVRVEPIAIEVEVEPGESVMDAAERVGYSWPTLCGGVGMCTMCWVRITAGREHVSPMQQLERDALEVGRWQDGRPEGDVRLGCQVRISGDVTVFKRGVNRAKRGGSYR